jgi:glucosylceramidase
MMFNKKLLISIFFGFVISLVLTCGKKSSGTGAVVPPPVPPVVPPVVGTNEVDFWLTTGDQSVLLAKQTTTLSFGSVANSNSNVDVDSSQAFQTLDGFGYSLTGGSAYVINRLPAAEKTNLLVELFGNKVNSIGISYLRISIGASDLNAAVFSYDDMPSGQTDITLANFSLTPDKTELIPLLKEILLINPSIKILATPWSPPVWMKDNGNSKGGSLQAQYYEVYAKYFVK